MKYEDKMLKVVEFVKKHSKADDYKLDIFNADDRYFRFGDNRITQNGTGSRYSVSLESAFGSKTGASNINSLNESDLLKMIKDSEEIALLNQEDPEYVETSFKTELPDVNNYAEATLNLSSEEMVNNIQKTIKKANSEKVNTSGITQKSINRIALSTKNGFYGYDEESYFEHSMTFYDKKRETKTKTNLKDYSLFSLDKELNKISNKLNALNNPIQSEKGKIPVILTPQAVANYFAYLMYSFDRRSADMGMNCFSNKLGTQLFGDKFNLSSRLTDKDLSTQKYSFDGLASKSVEWIKNGVLKELKTGRDWAKIKNLTPNFMCNWIIDGGNSSVEEMMSKVKRGLIINNFWYIRSVDARNGVWTGLTRDGVNYFEDGKIKHSVTNLRFNESHIELTKKILALGVQEQTGYSVKVPSMLVDDFNFVDVTSF